jgi:hypothetical protein
MPETEDAAAVHASLQQSTEYHEDCPDLLSIREQKTESPKRKSKPKPKMNSRSPRLKFRRSTDQQGSIRRHGFDNRDLPKEFFEQQRDPQTDGSVHTTSQDGSKILKPLQEFGDFN